MIALLLALQAVPEQPMRYSERAEKMAQIKAAGTYCHRFGMILDDWALRLYNVRSKSVAFDEGTGPDEAETIAFAAMRAEQRRIDESGGNPSLVGGVEANQSRYNAYWRDRCSAMKQDAFMMSFFPHKPSRQPDPMPPPSYSSSRMCYKDYCPCQGKQSPLDKLLCDRLEEGLGVSVEPMISGRSLRATQKEIDALK